MPVAVRLVEVLTLITLLGILTGFSLFIVFTERLLYVSLVILEPVASMCNYVLFNTERVLLFGVMSVLHLTTSFNFGCDCCN